MTAITKLNTRHTIDPLTSSIIKSLKFPNEQTIELVIHDGITIDLDGVIAINNYCSQFTRGKRVKRLVVSGRNSDITKQARQYGARLSEEHKENIIAEAVIVHSLPQKMIANFYFKYLKDVYPAKFFTDIDKAREWLEAQ
jgi:hypothetical protein